MKRRKILRTVGMVGVIGIAGCNSEHQSEPQDDTPDFDFAGVIVESLPTAERHLPLDVTVRIERAGTEKYNQTHTVENIVRGEAFRVTEAWMNERAPYRVTVDSPVHDPKSYTTEKLQKNDIQGKFSNKKLYFRFQLGGNAILFRPTPAE